MSASGRRCCSRTGLEFDHIVEFARGGEATVENLRLRCRAHNQLTAEQAFGAGFMEEKREAARRAAVDRRAPDEHALAHAPAHIGADEHAPAHAGAHARTMQSEDLETVTEAIARAKAAAAAESAREDVAPWLRRLGFGIEEVRRASAFCETVVGLSLEDRVRVAISYLRPGGAPAAA